MIDGQMDIEEVIEDIEQGRDSRRVYIPCVHYHYDSVEPVMREKMGSAVVHADPDEIPSYTTREEAQRIADEAGRGSGQTGMVWEIVLPAETTPSRGESENGARE